MKINPTAWLASLAAMPLALAHPSLAQEPFGLSPVQRPFQSADPAAIQSGKRFTFVCPASDGANATVYGTDVYTADSAVCAAAIHAGVLRSRQAGAVTVVMGSGAASFPGSSRNGITTRSYGPWDRSYMFARDGAPGAITWRTVWSGVPDDFVAPTMVECPPTRTVAGKLWGTDVYTRDSVVCVAAVHAGAITAENGGLIVVTRARQTTEFAASTRNGIASSSYGPFADAFSVTATVPAVEGVVPAGAASSAAAGGAAAAGSGSAAAGGAASGASSSGPGGAAAPASGGGALASGAAAGAAGGAAAGAGASTAAGGAAAASGSTTPTSGTAGSTATGAAGAASSGAAGGAATASGTTTPAPGAAGATATGAAAGAASSGAAGGAAPPGDGTAPGSGRAGSAAGEVAGAAASGSAAGGAGASAGAGAPAQRGASSTNEKPPSR